MYRHLCAVLLAATFFSGHAIAGEEDLVKYRKHVMEVIGGHMQAIVAIVKREVPYTDDLSFHAQALAAVAPLALHPFETKAMTEKSEALPAIWEDWDAFSAAANKLETTSAEFSDAVATGNMAAIGPALGALGKSCKGCHDDFVEQH